MSKGLQKNFLNSHVFLFLGDLLLICGVEEAGRGPVIGPMIICGVLIDKKSEKELEKLGVKDSKLLTPKKREQLFNSICSVAKDFVITVVSPKEIDTAVNSDKSNLNLLEAEKFAAVINTLKPDLVYVDCPSNNTQAYKQTMQDFVKVETQLVVENKADKNYIVVGAASILAKVTRDREIEKLKRKHKIEFGSGYPADPFTKQFLEKNYKKYPIFRKSWASWKNVAKKNGQRKLNLF